MTHPHYKFYVLARLHEGAWQYYSVICADWVNDIIYAEQVASPDDEMLLGCQRWNGGEIKCFYATCVPWRKKESEHEPQT